MKTGIRRPKLHKPTKGQKNYLKQGLKSLKRALTMGAKPTAPGQNWYTPKAVRAQYLMGFRGGHNAHQGGLEKARRVRQMATHKCINPEAWT